MSNVLEETRERGLLVGPEPYLATCERCGARLPMPDMPMKMSGFIRLLKSALNEHAVCPIRQFPAIGTIVGTITGGKFEVAR